MFFSTISVEEIRFGLVRKHLLKKRIWFDKFLAAKVTILDVNEAIAERPGTVRAELGLNGKTHSQLDMLIAATAWVHGLAVATRNTKDFEGCAVPVFNPFTYE
ncbi:MULTISPECIES: PIN domain-containing protein [unclassified Lentimonas]|uniref:PIN domain-containing protein n=1 Tax=unclassified Lentimonas TaxID=2630993 RepID=UPI0013894041|nr:MULTISPECIES: PIN domain-containing protein [unclassified Lentimonas]